MAKREVPIKNYFILAVITLATLLLVIYLVMWYRTTTTYNTSVMDSVLSEIKENELENYLQENPDVFIYLTSIKKQNKTFEKQFKNYIVENNLSKSIIFINVDNVDSNELKKYLNDESVEIIPNLLLVKDGKLYSSVYKNKQNLNLNDFKTFIESND